MYNFSKDGIVVSTVLDARTANKEGKYPVKIKVYYQRKPKYYSIGICMTKEECSGLDLLDGEPTRTPGERLAASNDYI